MKKYYYAVLVSLIIGLCGGFVERGYGAITSITLNNVRSTTLCAGDTVSVKYTYAATNTNIYYIQMSDNTGSFASPVLLRAISHGSATLTRIDLDTIPAGTAAGTYFIRINGVNGATCTPCSGNISVTISATPATPGAITGTASQCPNLTSQTYSIAAVANATSYNWTVPTGWSITAGTGTTSITVTTGNAGQNGSITVNATNGCGTSSNRTQAVTVSSNNTASAASSSPTLCINTALTPITHTTNGATGIGTATGLPAGVNAAWATNTITISGTPTASGTFSYSIPLTGGCGSVNATGTIVVLTNTVGAASSTPTLCINSALTPITHTTSGATGIGAATGLPAGVSATWATNTITISGTPTASGTFNYSIPLTGGCGSVNATGTIIVSPDNTVSSASTTPTVCINTALTSITHTTTTATGIGAATGLPAGVSAAWASNTITISGTPTASGTFSYSIPLTGGCGSGNATGTITVSPLNTAGAASSTPTLCINSALTPITHATTGATGIGAATGLPAGVSAAWATNTITISGTPTASGTFNYSIPLSGGCGSVNATGTIVVLTNTAGAASSSPTLCINTALTNITHSTTGATGIGAATGLPAGVSAAWATNTITISGTPTASGTFNYSIPLTGGCGSVNATGTIIVSPNNTVGAASSTPTLCINTALTNITHSTTGATGKGTATGLPTGVSAAWASNTLTILGTPTVAGTFNYSVPLTGGCGSVNATGTIVVTPANTAGAASSTPTLCINTSLTNITHSTTGATGIGVGTGLPAGVTAAWASNTITISGTPTASGTFNYSIPLTGGCGSVNATGTIIVTPANTAGAASSSPTLCINTSLTNITHTTTGATGIGAATGLPAGVSAAWASNTITIGGTPTASGTFTYSIPLTGGCGNVNATGTIIVTPANTVGAASSSPTLCINTALTPITHTTTGATGRGTATGLPAGVTSSWASNTLTISGTPTVAGTFNYSIPLTGGCGSVNATGTITVTPANTAGAASSSPTLCINTVLTDITHTTTGATGIGSATGLPAGVSATWASNTITISGTPTASGTFNYSVPLTGGCGSVNATGTIIVSPNNTVGAPSSTPTVCTNSLLLTNITHTTTGATGIGAAVGLPAGVTAAWASNAITISGTPTASGTFNYSIPLTGGCANVNATGTITVNPLPSVTVLTGSPSTICSGGATNITFDNSTNFLAGTTFDWTRTNTVNITGTNSLTNQTSPLALSLTNITNAALTSIITITPKANGCSGTPASVSVTVNPTPVIPTQTASVCSASTFTISPTNSGSTIVPTGTFYGWSAPIVTGGVSGGSALSNQGSISQTLSNPTNAVQTATYSVTPTSGASGACVGASFTTTITINPVPVVSSQTTASCSGSSFTISPVNGGSNSIPSTPGTTYTWTSPSVTGGITGGSAQATGQSSISQTLINPQNTVQTATYTITPTSGACPGSTFTAVVQANPIPVISTQNTTICSGTLFSVIPTNGGSDIVPTGTTYTWTTPTVTNGITGGSAQATGQSSIGQTLTNPTPLTGPTATYTVTPTSGASGNCIGSNFTTTVTVNPTPVIPAQTATICSGNAFTVNPTNGGSTVLPSGTTYTWTTPSVTGGITGGSAQVTGQSLISQTLTNPTNITQTATYTVTPKSGLAGSCVGSTFVTTVTINPTPVIPNQTSTICSLTSFTISPTNGGSNIVPSGTTYSWTNPTVTGGITGGSALSSQSPISQPLTNPTNTAQTATYTVTPTSGAAGSCVGSTFTTIVTVNPTPVIPTQTSTICSGNAFTVNPSNGGSTIVPNGTSYSWSIPNVSGGITGGSALSGQTSISQTLTNPTNVNQTATYTVTPTSGTSGNCVGSTFTATVTVDPTPVIPSQTATISSGSTFSITPSNGGSTIVPAGTTYIWSVPTVTGGITGGSAQVIGQTSISQTLTNPTCAVQTATYTVTPTSGAAGSCVGNTFTIIVTVNPTPTITNTPLSQSICSGSPSTAVTLTSCVAGATFSWVVSNSSVGISGFNASGTSTIPVQTINNSNNVAGTITYSITATANSVTSTAIYTITVNPTPSLIAQTVTICSGTTFTVSPTNGGGNIVPTGTTYTWTIPTVTNGITGGSAQLVGQSSIAQTLTNPTPLTGPTATYTVTPTSGTSGNCIGSTFSTTVNVNPTPVIPSQTATICSGTAFTVNPTNGGSTVVPSGTTYTWTTPSVTGGITGASAQVAGQSLISQTLTNPTNITQTATYTVTPKSGLAGSCVGSTFVTTVTINPTPVIPNQTSTICSLTSFTISPTNGGSNIVPSGTTYSWTNPTVTGGITGGSALSSQSPISQPLTNPTNTTQTATYTVTPTSGASGSCVGSTFTTIVTVNPTPVIPAQTSTICSGNAFSISPVNVQPTTIVPSGTIYQWTAPTTTGGITGGSAQTNQSIISQILTNPTNTGQTATYTVTPTSGSAGACVGSIFTAVVTVNPTPIVVNQTTSVCSGNVFSVNPITGGGNIVPLGTLYSWTLPTVTGGVTGASAQINQTSISQTLTNPTNVNQTATYTVTPNSGCNGSTFTIIVTFNSVPVIPNLTSSVCSQLAFNVSPQNSGSTIVPSGTTYSWSNPTITGGLFGWSASSNQSSVSQILNNPTNTLQTATYTVTPTSGSTGNCIGSTFTTTVTVNPTPVIPPQTSTICSLTSFSVNPINAQPTTVIPLNTTFSWSNPNVTGGIIGGTATLGASQVSDLLNNPTNTVQTATYTVTPTSGAAGSCVGSTFVTTVTVNPTPVVPNLASTICSLTSFTVNPINAQPSTIIPINTTYSWTIPNVTGGITGGTSTAGASQVSDLLNNPNNTSQTATYTVTPTSGAAGSCVGSTFVTTVTVNPTPVVPNQTSTICSLTSFSVNPINSQPTTIIPLNTTYTWPDATVTGGIIGATTLSGQTSVHELLNNPTNSIQTATYTVTPTSGVAGSCVGSTFVTTVTVNPTPVVPTQTSTICSLTSFNITPMNAQPATIIPLNTTYTWTNPTVTGGVLGGSAQTGLPQISDVLDNPTNLSQTATYTVVPTSGDAGSCIGAAFSLVVTVDPTPVVPAQTSTICSLTAFTVSPTNAQPTTIIPANTTYTWNTPSVTGGIIGGSVQVSQSQISEYLNNPTNLTQTATYTVTPTSGASSGCVGADFITTITVNPTPVVPTQTTTICSLTSFNILPVDAQPTTIIPSGTVYSWNTPSVTGGITGGSAQSSQSQISDFMDNPTNVTQTATYSVIPTSGAAGSCPGTTFTLLVTVDPTPVVPAQTETICSLNSFTILPVNAQPTTIIPVSTTYSWSIPSVSGGIIGGTNDALQSQINDTLNNPTNTTQTATYTITPTSGASSGCVGASFTAVITVNPTPVVPPQTSAICGDSIFIVNPINAQPSTIVPVGTTYSWSAPTGGVSGGTAQTGQSYVSDSLINLTNLNQSEIYTVYPTAGGAVGGCPGANFTIDVTVHPTPKIIPNNDTSSQCSGVQFSISPINGSPFSTTIVPAGTIYSWAIPTYAGAGGVTTNLINGNIGNAQSNFTQTLINLTTTTTYWATYMVTPTAGASVGGCTGPVFTIVDTVFPNPALPIVSNLTSIDSLVQVTICGGSTNISFNVDSVPNNTYQWTVTPTPLDSVLNPSSSNTVVTFGSSPAFDTARVSVTTTTPIVYGHCASAPSTFKITVTPGDGIEEKTITPMEPGNLLWYQDNSVDGYKWGYDTKFDRKPHFIDGQVYQVFVPNERFLDTIVGSIPLKTYLDTSHYWYWVQVYQGSCESKIYYNGPYRPKHFVKNDFVPDVMSVDILPNPNNGTFEISIKGNIFGTVQIKLFNTLGQTIYQKIVEKVLGIENYSMELNDLNKGIYMLEIDGMFEERILSKIIITK
ncbi:MAG: PKD-like domain-containing protein [Bacteroidota bacterium]